MINPNPNNEDRPPTLDTPSKRVRIEDASTAANPKVEELLTPQAAAINALNFATVSLPDSLRKTVTQGSKKTITLFTKILDKQKFRVKVETDETYFFVCTRCRFQNYPKSTTPSGRK